MSRIMGIWNSSALLEFLSPSGRKLGLQWTGYPRFVDTLFSVWTLLMCREQLPLSFTIGRDIPYRAQITAISDGCFRIAMLDTEYDVAPIWPRQKAAILLEVLLHIPPLSNTSPTPVLPYRTKGVSRYFFVMLMIRQNGLNQRKRKIRYPLVSERMEVLSFLLSESTIM